MLVKTYCAAVNGLEAVSYTHLAILFHTVGALAVPGYRSAEVCKSQDEAILPGIFRVVAQMCIRDRPTRAT